MLGPQFLDRRLADEGGGASANSVDAGFGFGATRSGANILYDGPVARVALAALGHLSPEARTLQHLQFTPYADRAQVSEDALAHVEVWDEGDVPFEVEAVGEAGLGQQLFRLLGVVFRHR